MLGLGLTALLGILTLPALEARTDALAGGLVLAVMVLGGTLVEGVTVGISQWLVLRHYIQKIGWIAWAGATALGAGIAWTLGMIPSLLINFGDTASANVGDASAAGPNGFVLYGLAAALGLVLGPMLGIPQWLVLRRYVPRAGWWVGANSVAWAVGMGVIFVGIDALISEESTTNAPLLTLSVLALLALVGASVGAVHGLVLVWLLNKRKHV
jgi:hypothetical protein